MAARMRRGRWWRCGNAYKFLRQNSAGSAYEAVALPLLFQGSGLLINGDFQVNQRSFAGGSLASGVYGFDRWRATGASVMTLSGYILTLSSGMITQFIEPAAFGLASLASTTITISVDTPSADLTVVAGSATGTITDECVVRHFKDTLEASIIRGHVAFQNYCVLCHGTEGKGDGRAAKLHTPRPFNLTQSMAPRDYIAQVVRKGGEAMGRGKGMPPWGDQLTDEQINDTLNYLMTIRVNK